MLRGRLAVLTIFVAIAAACAKSADSSPDEVGASSGAPRRVDAGGGGDGPVNGDCTLGTPDHCGACGTVCPGKDDESTVRTCSDTSASGTCDILCRGEFYDLDGDPANGCEAEDGTVQDSATNAVAITLPDVDDSTLKSNPLNVVAPLYGDNRKHETDPTSRPLGREDWYRVTAVGAGQPGVGMGACLSAVNFPKDDELEVCISTDGANTFAPTGCKALVVALDGGTSVCVYPGGVQNVDTGTFYVRVRRTKGTSNANQYALFLRH